MLATDRDALAQVAAFGYAVPTGPISAGFKTLATPFSDLPGYEYDAEEAKRLLKAAGAEGLEIEINVTPYIPMTINLAQVVKEQWKKAGITGNVMIREQQTWLEYLLQCQIRYIDLLGGLDTRTLRSTLSGPRKSWWIDMDSRRRWLRSWRRKGTNSLWSRIPRRG